MPFCINAVSLRASPLFVQSGAARTKSIYYETDDRSLLLAAEPKSDRAAPTREDFSILHFLSEISVPDPNWEGSFEAIFSTDDYFDAMALHNTPDNCELLKRGIDRLTFTSYQLNLFDRQGKERKGCVFSLIRGIQWYEGASTGIFKATLNPYLLEAGPEDDSFGNPFQKIVDVAFRETLSPVAKAIIEYVSRNTSEAGECRVRLKDLKKACNIYCGGGSSVDHRIRYEELPFTYSLEAKNPRRPSLNDIACFVPTYDA